MCINGPQQVVRMGPKSYLSGKGLKDLERFLALGVITSTEQQTSESLSVITFRPTYHKHNQTMVFPWCCRCLTDKTIKLS